MGIDLKRFSCVLIALTCLCVSIAVLAPVVFTPNATTIDPINIVRFLLPSTENDMLAVNGDERIIADEKTGKLIEDKDFDLSFMDKAALDAYKHFVNTPLTLKLFKVSWAF